MVIYLKNEIGSKYNLGSKIFKIIKGKKIWCKIIRIDYFGYKNHKTHIKFTIKKIK